MPRRQHVTVLTIIAVSAFVGFSFVLMFRNLAQGTRHPDYDPFNVPYGPSAGVQEQEPVILDDGILHGAATAPKLENATLK